MTPPNVPTVSDTRVVSLPISRAVQDGAVTVRVRRLANEVQVSAEIHCQDRDSAACMTLPRLLPGTAVLLAEALIQAATGKPVDLVAVLDGVGEPQPGLEDGN